MPLNEFPSWPFFDADERAAVDRVLASGRVNQWTGTQVGEFEREFAEAVGVGHAVALANGTVALELALRELGIGAGDDVVVTPRTFMASASSVVLTGGNPVFADVDADSQNITAESIERALTPNTRAVVPVHLAGWPCDMDEIQRLASEHKLFVIEDCAQAHGASYRGRPVGSFGDVAAWSFCQDKIMTTGGEGGMVATNDRSLWSKMWAFKDHGKSWEAVYEREHPPGFRWVHESFGTNWRMTEMQAAIGRLQLGKLPAWSERRRRNAGILASRLSDSPVLRVPMPPKDVEHAYYKFYAFVRPEQLASGWSRDRIEQEISERGVFCRSGSCSEIYLEKAFEGTGWVPEPRLPVAKELGETSLMFQVHPTLGDDDMHKMADVAADVLQAARR